MVVLVVLSCALFLQGRSTPKQDALGPRLGTKDVRIFSQADPQAPPCRTSRRAVFPGVLAGDRIWNATKLAPRGRYPLAGLRISPSGASRKLHWFAMFESESPRWKSLPRFLEETPPGWFVALLALGSLHPESDAETLAPQWKAAFARVGARQAPVGEGPSSAERPPSWVHLAQRMADGSWRPLGEVLEPSACAELNRTLP